MANKAVTKQARRAARLAAAAAQDELLRRTRANVEDLAAFFTARERAEAVDEWLAERQQVLCEQAAARRSVQRVQCGRALRAMRDRGESLREIARMAGVAEKTALELIREADAAPDPDGAAGRPEGGARTAVAAGRPWRALRATTKRSWGEPAPAVNVMAGERVEARAQA
jgi:hypothetical protein